MGLYAALAGARRWLAGRRSRAGTAAAGCLGLGLALWAVRAAARRTAGLGARSAVARNYALLTVDSDDDELPRGRSGRYSGAHQWRMP